MSNVLDEEKRYELQDGVLVPVKEVSYAHARVHFNLGEMLNAFSRGKTCRLLGTTFPVYLFYGREDVPTEYKRPVFPDLMVVCNPEQLDRACCKGAPDFVVEILSESDRNHDVDQKFDLYERAGVREYWMVCPEVKRVFVCERVDSRFSEIRVYREKDKVPVLVLPGCVIDLEQVFGDL